MPDVKIVDTITINGVAMAAATSVAAGFHDNFTSVRMMYKGQEIFFEDIKIEFSLTEENIKNANR